MHHWHPPLIPIDLQLQPDLITWFYSLGWILNQGCYHLAIFYSSLTSVILQYYQNTDYLLNIMAIFDMCHHSIAKVTLFKYESDPMDETGTTAKDDFFLIDKLSDTAYVTLILELQAGVMFAWPPLWSSLNQKQQNSFIKWYYDFQITLEEERFNIRQIHSYHQSSECQMDSM